MAPAGTGKTRRNALSIAAMVALWAVASAITGDQSVLPSPLWVLPNLWYELQHGPLLLHMGATLGRVLAAFAIAMLIGVSLGVLMGRRRALNEWLDPWLVAALNIPALVTIVLCYLWIGLSEAAAVIAVSLNKIPLVTTLVRESARHLDRELDDMATVYQLSRWQRVHHLMWPQLAPTLATASRTGLALIWKIVLVVEFLGRGNGIGFQIHLHFQQFDVGQVLTYSLSFIVVMLLIEHAILQPWEKRVSRWRNA